jgi:small-conductance mechanosensitive channel
MAIVDVLLKAESVFTSMSFYLNKVIIALVIIMAGFIVGKIVEGILRNVFARMNIDDRLSTFFAARRNYARAIRRSVVRIIYIVAIVIALEQVSLFQPVLTLLEFLAVVVILISVSLAGVDVIPNLAARAALRHKRLAVGDDVVFTDQSGVIQGTIIDMTLIDVRIKRRNGDVFFIPNAVFLKQSIAKKRRA